MELVITVLLFALGLFMPFVKKTDSRGSQPESDTRKIFVGREGELLFFVQNILKAEDPTHNIISISGQGGVGKSTLLARFIDEAHAADFKDYCLTAIVDERQTTPTSIMGKFADQLHITGDFDKALRQYKEALRKLQAEQEQVKRQLALDAALLSRPFNRDDLEAFSYLPEEKRSDHYQWLIELPFVRTSPQDGRHNYHDLVQALFSRHLYQRSRKEYYATRRAVADYYRGQLEKTQVEGHNAIRGQGRSIYRSTEWLELAMAIAYQLFLQPDNASHQSAVEQVLNAHEYTAQTGEIIRVLRKLIQEQATNQLGSTAQQSIKLLLRYIEADSPIQFRGQELVAAADALLKTVEHEPSFSVDVLAYIYRERGFAYKRLKEYVLAIADYNRALELSPNYARAYASRGSAYRSLREYELAIADYNRALELWPNYAWVYTGRGRTYSYRKEYMQSISDLNRAIEIAPDYAWAYFARGSTHLWLKDSVQAREDFIQSLELNPKDVYVRWMVEWSGMGKERPAAGVIQHLEAIAALDSQDFWALVCRGVALWLSRRFEEALIFLDQAIQLKPAAWAWDPYFWKGMVCASLGREEEAMAAVEKALEVGLPPVLLTPLQ